MNNNQLLEEISKRFSGKVVSCPLIPAEIPGITAADEVDAGDAMGTLLEIDVPKSGVIYSATYYSLDDDAAQTDFAVFKYKPKQATHDAAWTLGVADVVLLVTELSFVAFDDHAVTQTSELTNIGTAYRAPEGKLWLQAITRAAVTIAANLMPRVQLQILSDEPDFKER